MCPIANSPEPPYYAVIFSSHLSEADPEYHIASQRMQDLAAQQPGYLGFESVREGEFGISISYWTDLTAISRWKNNLEHQLAQKQGRERWYSQYRVRICKVERESGFIR
jgi:heme-degrading monooxygenase HmoA